MRSDDRVQIDDMFEGWKFSKPKSYQSEKGSSSVSP